MRTVRIAFFLILMSNCCGCCASNSHTWKATTENGCKPAIGYLLNETDGVVTSGKLFILDPNSPGSFDKGVAYDMTNIQWKDRVLSFDVTVVDEAAETHKQTLHQSISFKGKFSSHRIEATTLDGGVQLSFEEETRPE
jgi:hypothetical protein